LTTDEPRTGFLPPEPAGPEPELGDSPRAAEQAATGSAPPPYGGQQGHGHAPPAPGQAPPQPPPGWQQPPPRGYPPAAREPDNGPAVAGFVLALVGGGLLFLSAGLSTVISLGCAVAGIIYSRKGKQKVDSGETGKNRGLAQAGYVIGIVSTVLAALATIFWVLVLVLALADESFRNDLDNEFDDSNSISASLRIGAAVLKAGTYLLG
jgi:hypothetical protein